MIRLPRPTQLIRWPLLVERSPEGARRRARVGAGSGVALFFLGLLWAAGLGWIAEWLLVGTVAAAALLELAAAVQASGVRRLLAGGRTAARVAAAAGAARLPLVSRSLARGFATTIATGRQLQSGGRLGVRLARTGTAAALTAARPTASRTAAFAADALRRARRRREAIAAEQKALRLNALGTQLRRSGAAEAAADQHRAALAIVRALGDKRAEALTLNNVALALAPTDDNAAVKHFEQAATILRQLGDSQHEGQVIANLGITRRRQGRAEEADRLLETALAKLDPETPEHRQVREQLRRAS